MKQIVAVMAVVLMTTMVSAAFAEEKAVAAPAEEKAAAAPAEEKVTGAVYVGPVSKYLFRGLDLSENRGVIQGGVDLSYKGFTLSYWSNYQTVSGPTLEAGETTETDIILNYSFTPVDLLTLNVGNLYYTMDNAEDTNEVYLKATLNTLLSPTFAVYYDWDIATKTGLFYTLSIAHTFPVAEKLGVTLGALAGYNMENPSASEDYNNLHNYELTASADYAVTDSIKISPSYLYSNAFNSTARDAGVKDQSVVAIKATYSF